MPPIDLLYSHALQNCPTSLQSASTHVITSLRETRPQRFETCCFRSCSHSSGRRTMMCELPPAHLLIEIFKSALFAAFIRFHSLFPSCFILFCCCACVFVSFDFSSLPLPLLPWFARICVDTLTGAAHRAIRRHLYLRGGARDGG